MTEDAMTRTAELKYNIDTELSRGNVQFLPEYLRRQYLLQHEKYRAFWDIRIITENQNQCLSYKVVVPKTNQYIEVAVKARRPIGVTMRLSDPNISKKFVNQLYEDLFLIVQMFEDEVRETTLNFAFMPGEKFVPDREETSVLIRVFTDSMLPLYIALIAFTFVFFWLFDMYAPIVFVVISFTIAAFSGKLIAKTGHWEINKDQPDIYLLQYHLTPYAFEAFRERYGKKIPEIRKEIYEASIASGLTINCETAGDVFAKYGIDCTVEDFSVKKVNLFQIVQKAAQGFELPLPKITVMNTIIPNAAAAGLSPSLGTILVTTGIMTQLEEDEILSIIGHELSHLKAHDALVMLVISNIEYLLRFYVFWPSLFVFGFYSYWLYSLIAIGLIYFFGKFIEGRADLDSAKILGEPKVLAEALKKIAFRRLFPLVKREPAFRGYRRLEWMQFDPHPPAYFRIAQLEKIQDPKKIQNTFLKSIKDSVKGVLQG